MLITVFSVYLLILCWCIYFSPDNAEDPSIRSTCIQGTWSFFLGVTWKALIYIDVKCALLEGLISTGSRTEIHFCVKFLLESSLNSNMYLHPLQVNMHEGIHIARTRPFWSLIAALIILWPHIGLALWNLTPLR